MGGRRVCTGGIVTKSVSAHRAIDLSEVGLDIAETRIETSPLPDPSAWYASQIDF